MNGRLSSDFYHLMNSIKTLSDGQATVCEWDSDDISKFIIEVKPSSGPYKGGKFKFKFDIIELFYPIIQPNIKCITPIYHPNIDTLVTDKHDMISNVCVSMLDDWKPMNGLDDCVQAILFLFHQPNTSDSLRLADDDDIEEKQFLENVKISLKGGTVENCNFQPNYGWIETRSVSDNKTRRDINQTGSAKKKVCIR